MDPKTKITISPSQLSYKVDWRPSFWPLHSSWYMALDQLDFIFSTERCSSSRNSLRGITHSPSPHFGGGATSSFDGIIYVWRPSLLLFGNLTMTWTNISDVISITWQALNPMKKTWQAIFSWLLSRVNEWEFLLHFSFCARDLFWSTAEQISHVS